MGVSGPKVAFNGRYLSFGNRYRAYIDLNDEKYEITVPTFSVHNLIFGRTYTDLGGEMIVRNLTTTEYSISEFTRRGWLNTDRDSQKVSSTIYTAADKNAKKEKDDNFAAKGGKPMYKIEGRWSDKLVLHNLATKQQSLLWQKASYPKNWQWMYGMTHFNIQLNNFPPSLQNIVAPTDTRRRPD